jgi:hypothetical protein
MHPRAVLVVDLRVLSQIAWMSVDAPSHLFVCFCLLMSLTVIYRIRKFHFRPTNRPLTDKEGSLTRKRRRIYLEAHHDTDRRKIPIFKRFLKSRRSIIALLSERISQGHILLKSVLFA